MQQPGYPPLRGARHVLLQLLLQLALLQLIAQLLLLHGLLELLGRRRRWLQDHHRRRRRRLPCGGKPERGQRQHPLQQDVAEGDGRAAR